MIIQDTFRLDLTGMTQFEAHNAIEDALENIWARQQVLRQKLVWAQKQGIHELPAQHQPFPCESGERGDADRLCPTCNGRKFTPEPHPYQYGAVVLAVCAECDGTGRHFS